MSKTPGKTPQSTVTRQFESSRHGYDNLATAFERVLPTISRVVGRDRTPTMAVVEPRRVARAVS
jgi:hypothetical protein